MIEWGNFFNGHSPDDSLAQLALQDVKNSGLSPEIVQKAGIRLFSGGRDDLKERLGRTSIDGHELLKEFKLIEVPCTNEKGEPQDYYFKIVPPAKDEHGKDIKYLHPIGKPALPYILPEVWAVKDKVNKPVWITEGVKKALKLFQHGRYVIALSGVWNFKASKNYGLEKDKSLWAELDAFHFRGRTVYLAFDMDLWTNPLVRMALYELSFKLFERGAVIRVVTWEGGKGVDDHLAAQAEPEQALQSMENSAIGLCDFFNTDYRLEIIRGLSFIENAIEREILLKAAARSIGVSYRNLNRVVSAEAQKRLTEKQVEPVYANSPTDNLSVSDGPEPVDPHPEPVRGDELLRELHNIFSKYVILPEHTAVALSLWTLHTYMLDAAEATPILAIESPEPRCGKTTLVSVASECSHASMAASNISPAALFRCIERWKPTLFIDEGDAFLKDNEELRGILNSGHTRSTAYVIRCQGEEHEPTRFCTWGAKAIALIGKLPATLEDRSIVISMRRKKKSEKVDRLRLDKDKEFFLTIRQKLARFSNDNMEILRTIDPSIPQELHDRAADNWRILLAIADIAGGEWPEKARQAALFLSGAENESETVAVQLLRDFQCVFHDHGGHLQTSTVIEYLCRLEERPWGTWNHGKAITARQIAKILKPFSIISRSIRIGEVTGKGYLKESFEDAFSRYLASGGNLSVTTSQANIHAGLRDFLSVTSQNHVTDEKACFAAPLLGCDAVTDKKGGNEEIIDMELAL